VSVIVPAVARLPARQGNPVARSLYRAAAPLLTVALTGLALFVRSLGLTHSFELWVDEMVYADLGASMVHGVPRLADGPFFLHPPGFFLLEAGVIRVFGLPTEDSMRLVFELRWVTAVLGALSVGLAFMLMRRLAGSWLALAGALILVYDPFMLRINSRVFLETLACLAVIAGQLVLVDYLQRRDRKWRRCRLLVAGLLLGYAVVTKDTFAIIVVAPLLLAVAWRRTLRIRDVSVVLAGVVLPYAVWVATVWGAGYMHDFVTAKTQGVLRLIGARKTTGFTAPGAPSLVNRLLDQAQHYGTSYVLLLACPLLGVLVAFSARPERRLIGLSAVTLGAYAAYLVAFGTLEEQYAYPVIPTSVTGLAVAGAEIAERRARLRPAAATAVAGMMGASALLGMHLERQHDDGFLSFRAWVDTHLAADARVGVTNDTSIRAFGNDPRFGAWATPATLNQAAAEYVLTVSLPTEQGYALAQPSLLDWLSANALPVWRYSGPTNGQTVLWVLGHDSLSRAALDGGDEPVPGRLDPGTLGPGAFRVGR
jgi:4-amino-4-deoxy-L-arabinose transferase-like glycosyltransferase